MMTPHSASKKTTLTLSVAALLAASLACKTLTNVNLSSGQKVEGIDVPVSVNGVEVQLTSAEESDEYTLNGEQHRPTFPDDTLLIVKGNLAPSGVEAASDWKVFVTDSNGNKIDVTITSWWTKDASDPLGGRAEWVFVVPKSASGFALSLPQDVVIQLSSLMK